MLPYSCAACYSYFVLGMYKNSEQAQLNLILDQAGTRKRSKALRNGVYN